MDKAAKKIVKWGKIMKSRIRKKKYKEMKIQAKKNRKVETNLQL